MELATIKRIEEIINERRTWIAAELSLKPTSFLSLLDGNISVSYSPSLILKVLIAQCGYRNSQKWIIPEVMLEKSARKIKAEDSAFWQRLVAGSMTSQDVERLIRDATYGIVKLELDDCDNNVKS